MTELAASVVTKFSASWLRWDADEMVAFFTDDAVYTDGPRGVHRGIAAIRAEFQEVGKVIPSTAVDITTLVANGGTVIVERVDNFEFGGKPFALELVGVFETDNGRIKRWRDYYDSQSVTSTEGG